MKQEKKDLLKEYKLEDMQKRFQQIVEYTFITSPTLSEEGEDEETPEDANSDTSDTGNEEQNVENMPQDTNNGNEDYTVTDTETEQTPDNSVDTTPMQDGDEVMDVDDLTNSQEEIEYKVDGVDDKLLRIAKVIDKLIPAIEANSNKIEDLKSEFEKRNPTEEEKINLRSQDSYPYTVKPKDYWNAKSNDGNYNVMYDNNVSPNDEEKEYVLRKSDIANNSIDDRSVYKSFDVPKQMSDYLNMF